MSLQPTLTLITYNVKHLNKSKGVFINDLFSKCDFLFLQEHCLYENQLNIISTIIPNVNFHGVSSMNENVLNHGRPHGGAMIVWNNNIKHKISIINTNSNRLCCIVVHIDNDVSIILFNVYMPCDERTRGDNFNELCCILDDIRNICEQINTPYVIIGGDFNIDFGRSTHHSNELSYFIDREELFKCLDAPCSNIDYTFSSAGIGNTSLIDHFFATETLFKSITHYYKIDSIDNPSDHCALICSFKFNVEYFTRESKVNTKRLSWCKATDNDLTKYRYKLDNCLMNICVPVEAILCNNLFCNIHNDVINNFYNDIVDSCKSASVACIPHSINSNEHDNNIIAGWNENIKEKREISLFWHFIWKENGKPRNGVIANIARRTRATYHYAIRSAIKNQTKIRSHKMAESICRNSTRDFWREVKQIKRQNKSVPLTVDGYNNDTDILNTFKNKYEQLYNSVPYCPDEIDLINDDLNELIVDEQHTVSCIYAKDIADAISHLKKGKTGLGNMLSSDSFLNGSNKLNVLLAMLFNCILKHGTTINDMLLGIMSPIPKGKRCNDSNSENYRAITIGSLVGKIFDWVILLKNSDVLYSDDLQFGFKKDLSTTLCTAMVVETVAHYNVNGSNVYGLFLDASKAFDRINFHKLFRKLIDIKLPAIYVRSLLNNYTNSKLQVKWNNVKTDTFKCSNGVKQGGVLSPILFSIYVDDLLKELRVNSTGCHVNTMFCGAFAYADDIVLLSPTVTGLKSMVDVCQNYSKRFDINFNPNKSQLITFSNRKNVFNPILFIGNHVVPCVTSVKHLGHTLYCNILKRDCDRIISDFNMRVNMFHGDFGKLHCDIKSRLFKQYCCSFYGSQLYNLCSNDINMICRAWRVGFKRILGLPRTTHCNLLSVLGNTINPHDIFIKRFLKFFTNAFNSNNTIVNYLCKMSCTSNSSMGNNFRYICYRFGYTHSMFNSPSDIMNVFHRHIDSIMPTNDLNRCNMIRELVDMRDGYQSGILGRADIDEILLYVCTY